ncbi:hypothetical protein VTG60DRAFT_722 [Thermothelomyces hinnuleus]
MSEKHTDASPVSLSLFLKNWAGSFKWEECPAKTQTAGDLQAWFWGCTLCLPQRVTIGLLLSKAADDLWDAEKPARAAASHLSIPRSPHSLLHALPARDIIRTGTHSYFFLLHLSPPGLVPNVKDENLEGGGFKIVMGYTDHRLALGWNAFVRTC